MGGGWRNQSKNTKRNRRRRKEIHKEDVSVLAEKKQEEQRTEEKKNEGRRSSWIRMGKTLVQFFRLSTLSFLIEFKHMVALINEIQTIYFFPRIFKFNVFEFN